MRLRLPSVRVMASPGPWGSSADAPADRGRPNPRGPWLGSPEALTATTTDGVQLSLLAYGDLSSPVAIVFGHGFTGSQLNDKVVDLARHTAALGVAFYTLDFRGHGASGGQSTLGDLEVLDLETAVGVARRRHRQVVTVGASMGGFTCLRHAALHGGVDAVVSISSPAFGCVPRLPRARALALLARAEGGRRLLEMRGTRVQPNPVPPMAPLELTDRIAPIPVALVHGTRDRYVPLDEARALHDRLPGPKRLVVLPGFGHGEAGFGPSTPAELRDLVDELLGEVDLPPPEVA